MVYPLKMVSQIACVCVERSKKKKRSAKRFVQRASCYREPGRRAYIYTPPALVDIDTLSQRNALRDVSNLFIFFYFHFSFVIIYSFILFYFDLYLFNLLIRS